MEEEYPRPTSRRCPSCGSYNVVERREEASTVLIVLKLHCNACRRDVIFWTGSKVEERRFKKRRNALRRRLGV
jgi:hypothetical protein